MKESAHDVRSDASNVTQFRNYLLSKNTSKVTVKNYASDVNHFITWFENEFRSTFSPDLVSLETIEYYKKSNSHKLSASSLDRHISALRKFFNFLKLESIVMYDPTPRNNKAKVTQKDPWMLKDFKDYLYVYNASGLTIKNYLLDIRQFLRWFEEVSKAKDSWKLEEQNLLPKINSQVLEEYRNRLVRSSLNMAGFSPRSVNRKLSSLRKYFSWLEEAGHIQNQSQISNLPTSLGDIRLSSVEALHGAGKSQIYKPDVAPGASYSPFPPMRLIQKVFKGTELILDFIFFSPLAAGINDTLHVLWVLRGKPVFDRIKNKELRVRNLPKEAFAPLSISTIHLPLHRKLIYHIRHSRPKWYKIYHSYPLTHYFHFAILIVFITALTFAFYSSFTEKPSSNEAVLAAVLPQSPPRIFSFQGRLTDSTDNPITTSTNLRFTIYDHVTASGSALKWQEVNTVTPDADGIFSLLLGQKTTLSQSLFINHAGLWLGITVGLTPELTPRQQLATVAFAQSSDLLQGLPPITQTGAGTTNVVLALDSSGNLTIGGTATPTFQASGGRFTLSGNPLLLTTNAGSNGNVQIAPNGTSFIDLQKPAQNSTNNNNIATARGALEIDDMFAVLATSSGQSAFTLDQNSTGPIISASASGVARFTVDNSGNTTISGNFLSALTASRDLGSSSVRWNNLWVQTINATGTNTSGQASFTYDPADTTYAQGTVLINPTSAGPNELLLAAGVGGVERASFDTEGDLVIGFAGGTVTRNSNPLTVYNHGTTQVASIDTSGTLSLAAGQGVDTLAAGVLGVGNTTATTVNIGNSAATTLALGAGGALTRTINIGTGTGADTINIGTGGTGADVITIGNSASQLGLSDDNWSITAAGVINTSGNITTTGGVIESLTQFRSGSANDLILNANGANRDIFLQVNGTTLATVQGSTGRLGIGDTSPTAKLDVGDSQGAFSQSDGAAISGSSAGGAVNALLLQNKATQAAGNAAYLNFGGLSDWMARVEGGFTTAGNGYLQFWTANTGTILERMRIDKDGNVGIGTTGPSGNLHVRSGSSGATVSASADELIIEGSASNVGLSILTPNTSTAQISFGDPQDNNAGNITYNHSTNLLSLRTNGLNVGLHIDSSGGVGIGTSSPGEELEVSGLDNGELVALIRGDNTGTSVGTYKQLAILNQNISANTQTGLALQHYNASSAIKDAAIINASLSTVTAGSETGYLTISTISSGTLGERLRVDNGRVDTTGAIYIRDTGCNCQVLNFADSSGTALSHILNVGGIGNGIRFAPGNNNRMTIFPGGQLYVGGADPGTTPPITLQVIGDARVGTSGTNGCVQRFDGASLVGTCSSDIAFKKNIEGILSSLEKLVLLNPVTFEFRSDEFPDKGFGKGTKIFGLIAQEVEKIFPELVGVDKDGYKTVSYGVELQMLTIQSIKELYNKVKGLEDKSCVQSISDFGLVKTDCTKTTVEKLTDYVLSRARNEAELIVSGAFVIKDSLGETVINTQVLANAVIGNLRVGMIDAQEILADRIQGAEITSPLAKIKTLETNTISNSETDKLVIKLEDKIATDSVKPVLEIQNSSGSAVAAIDDSGNASFSGTVNSFGLVTEEASVSGTLRTKNLIADNIESQVAGIKSLVSSLIAPTASDSADIASYSATLAYIDTLQAVTGMFTGGISSTGPSLLTDLTVFGQLSIGTKLTLADNAINVLGEDLELQPLGQGGVSFLAGKVYIDTNGNMTVSGDATFNGNLFAKVLSPIPGSDLAIKLASDSGRFEVRNASNSAVASIDKEGFATFKKINIGGIVSPVYAELLSEVVATGSAGIATISATFKELTIKNNLVTDKSLIYVSPVGAPSSNIPFLIRQKPNESFTVGVENQALKNIPFNWLIIN